MPTTLRDFVIARMAELHLSQTDLAERSGLSISDINGVVQGRIKLPGAAKRREIARALKVSHLDLLLAAGEITQDELGPVAGVVQVDPCDPRQQLHEAIDITPMTSGEVELLLLMFASWREAHRRLRT